MKTLGLIGGTSWHATIAYYRLINELAGKQMGTQENPPMLIHSINIKVMREQNLDKINATYLDVAQKLEKAGAKAIVICANTPHIAYDFLQPKINIPILHIADATGREAVKLGLNKLGLLGNRPTMTKGFIPQILKHKYAIETLIPQEESVAVAHNYVSNELTQGVCTDKVKGFFLEEIGRHYSRVYGVALIDQEGGCGYSVTFYNRSSRTDGGRFYFRLMFLYAFFGKMIMDW